MLVCGNPLCRKPFEQIHSNNKKYCCRTCGDLVSSRISRGIDLNRPFRIKKGFTTEAGNKGHLKRGYIIVYKPDCPISHKDGFILEHRYVAWLNYGSRVTKKSTIHHKNGIKTDNRIENLEIREGPHGSGQSVSDLIVWAVEFLGRHGYLVQKAA